MSLKMLAVVAAPALAPTVMVVLGVEVPVLAALLSLAGVVLARFAVPKPPKPASLWRYVVLTLLLCVIDIALIIENKPGVGSAVAIGVGLGATGMLVVSMFGDRIAAVVEAVLGGAPRQRDGGVGGGGVGGGGVGGDGAAGG